jgi:hypothetical protein
VVAHHEAEDAVDEVGDVAEGAGLGAVAEDGDGLALEGLAAEGGDDAAVLGAHARAVGVEDADDAGFDAVVAVVGHDDGFGEALGFVVDAAGADGVDVAPVGFDLRMDEGVAVDLGGGGEQEARALGLGQAEGVVGAQRADLEGLDRQFEVVDGAGGRGEVEDVVQGAGKSMWVVTLWWMNSKSVRERRWAMLSRLPVRRLSMARRGGLRRGGGRRGGSRGSRRRR